MYGGAANRAANREFSAAIRQSCPKNTKRTTPSRPAKTVRMAAVHYDVPFAALEAQKKVSRSPADATQRHQFIIRSPPPQCPLGPPWCVNAALRLADHATARAFARRRTPQNGRAGGLGGARGRRGGEKGPTPTPNATQGCNCRSPIAPSAPWGHPGAYMRGYGPSRTRKPPKSLRSSNVVADLCLFQ